MLQNIKVEYRPLDALLPYARNARTHSDAQVAQIAASIVEYGWTNPVLVDGKNGIIAGHGRVLAAHKLGLKDVPVINFNDMPKSVQRNGMKDVICADCGTEFSVRKDTHPTVCTRCASSRGGKAMKGFVHNKTKFVQCKLCKKLFRQGGRTRHYCSKECRTIDKHIERVCKFCGNKFYILKSSLNTNATGNFCSRTCYNKWQCDTERITGRGSQWKKIRNKVKNQFQYCILCGTRNNIDIHHIVPFRVSHDNSTLNLIPLCKKHHKFVEALTCNILQVETNMDRLKYILRNILTGHMFSTACFIKMIFNKQREIDCAN